VKNGVKSEGKTRKSSVLGRYQTGVSWGNKKALAGLGVQRDLIFRNAD
jgi:hypothetical protein